MTFLTKNLNLESAREKIWDRVWQAEENAEFVSDVSKKFDMKLPYTENSPPYLSRHAAPVEAPLAD